MSTRREVVGLLGGAAAWPSVARAQQASPVIGFLGSASPHDRVHLVNAFRDGLKQEGFSEGRNLAIEFRWAENQYERLPLLAADLAERRVAAITATGGAVSALAAKATTSTIPIIFVTGSDPVKTGLVESLARPTANITGATTFTYTLAAKRLELLRSMVKSTLVGMLVNPHNPDTQAELLEMQTAARSTGQRSIVVNASTEHEIASAFTMLVESGAGAVIVGGGAFFASQRDLVIALAANRGLPTSYPAREFAIGGGLMSYGANLSDAYFQAGSYTGRILKGTKPTELPVTQPTKFQLILNLRTAKSLGLAIPPTLLALADEVIE